MQSKLIVYPYLLELGPSARTLKLWRVEERKLETYQFTVAFRFPYRASTNRIVCLIYWSPRRELGRLSLFQYLFFDGDYGLRITMPLLGEF